MEQGARAGEGSRRKKAEQGARIWSKEPDVVCGARSREQDDGTWSCKKETEKGTG